MLHRVSYRWLAIILACTYGIVYLYAIGDLSFSTVPSWDAYIAELSLERVFTARSVLMYEAVAVVEVGYLVCLISPLNLLMAGLLSSLLAANIHGALYLRSQPQHCSTGKGGLFAGALPALIAGGACCAPSLILLIGIPALGAFSAFFGWLMPLSLIALGFNRIWQYHKGAPVFFGKMGTTE